MHQDHRVETHDRARPQYSSHRLPKFACGRPFRIVQFDWLLPGRQKTALAHGLKPPNSQASVGARHGLSLLDF